MNKIIRKRKKLKQNRLFEYRKDGKLINRFDRARNARKGDVAGSKGCSYCRTHKKWISRIMVDGKNKNLGGFKTEEEAREVYLKAKKELHDV